MRPSNQSARDQLRHVMRRGSLSAPAIAQSLGVSSRTALRLLDEIRDALVSAGPPIRRRYALRRSLRGDAHAQPLFMVDREGRAVEAGSFSLIEPQGSWLDLARLGWPVDDPARDGWWPGLPYPLYDMQPQGYLGRLFARREQAALEIAPDPRAWSDDDVAWILSRRGAGLPGNLILGEQSLRLYQQRRAEAPPAIAEHDVGPMYRKHADEVIALGLAGSSAAGEFPKFIAARELADARTPHVIVKFSGREEHGATARWSDLLVCEHLALNTLASACPSAVTRIVQHGGRTFLESERFDRHGGHGRSPVVSLAAAAAHLLDLSTTDWRTHADALVRLGLLNAEGAHTIHELWWFGVLIGNTDMHLGNLGLIPQNGCYSVAPAYDMLPMAWAPLPGGEIAPGRWSPALPLPSERDLWQRMCTLAIEFWNTCAADPRISTGFRSACASNAAALDRLSRSGVG